MDVQTVGAWGELLGGISGTVAAIGVILTLLYLARQIHQYTEQSHANIAHQLMASLRDAILPTTELVNADVYRRGFPGLDNLSQAERFVFATISLRFYRVFEEAFLHHQAGRLEKAYWQSISGQFRQALTTPGIREDWRLTRDNFDAEFKQWVDTHLID